MVKQDKSVLEYDLMEGQSIEELAPKVERDMKETGRDAEIFVWSLKEAWRVKRGCLADDIVKTYETKRKGMVPK